MRRWFWIGPATPAAMIVMAVGCGSNDGMGVDGGDDDDDDVVAAVAISSPIGDRMAVGRQLQLGASATNSSGVTVTTSFTWMSSNDAVASVNGSGLVAGLAPGPTMVSAMADGVSGTLSITVVDADLDGIGSAVNDGYASALIDAMPGGSQTTLSQLFADCATAVADGHINNLAACLEAASAAIASPSTPEATVLATYLGLYIDHAERLLNLE